MADSTPTDAQPRSENATTGTPGTMDAVLEGAVQDGLRAAVGLPPPRLSRRVPDDRRCKARSKRSRVRCCNPSMWHVGSDYCRMHGGSSLRGEDAPGYVDGERSGFIPRKHLGAILAELDKVRGEGAVSIVEFNLAERRVRRRHLPDDVAGDLDVALKLDAADRGDVDCTVRARAMERAAENEGAVSINMFDLSSPPIVTVTGPDGKAARLLTVGDLRLIQTAPGVWCDAVEGEPGVWHPVVELPPHPIEEPHA